LEFTYIYVVTAIDAEIANLKRENDLKEELVPSEPRGSRGGAVVAGAAKVARKP
jgi:hypothetical protein